MSATTGVLLLNLGAPDSLTAVRPFLFNLFCDPEIIKFPGSFILQKPFAWLLSGWRARKSKKYYEALGGGSPLLDITQKQARALEERLNREGQEFIVRVAMRYWRPDTEEALTDILHAGVKRIIALPLYPQYSAATTGSSFNELKRVLQDFKNPVSVVYIDSWYNNPDYLEVMAKAISQGLENLALENRRGVACYAPTIIFSAHNLPKKLIDQGDPYIKQTQATIEAILKKIPAHPWALSFQSKSGPVEWLEPSTEETIKKLAQEGVKSILVVPINFVSDHVETLYEIDIYLKELAEDLGVHLERCPMPNDKPEFIEALAGVVEKYK